MNATETRNEFVATLKDSIADYKKSLKRLSNVLLGQGYIVWNNEMAITFEVDPKTRGISDPRVIGNPAKAIRMTKDEAERIAAVIFDGAMRPAKAIHVVDALQRSLANCESILAALEAASKK